jgi:hypothetical protein
MNAGELLGSRSHGRGRWFETSIAHLRKAAPTSLVQLTFIAKRRSQVSNALGPWNVPVFL